MTDESYYYLVALQVELQLWLDALAHGIDVRADISRTLAKEREAQNA